MCTIAGYNGTKSAAPILIEMMRKLEGLDSGFYTGIATMHQGKIYYAKVAGNLDTLLASTVAASLPGTMGFIHSRTPGPKELADFAGVAHPFTAEKDGQVRTALIMNGCGGIFKGTFDVSGMAQRMIDQGYELKSYHETIGNTALPGGGFAHGTDVRCQLTDSKIAAGMDMAEALQETFTQMPCEAVSLAMSVTEPNAIAFARLVMPMHVALTDHGVYMATGPLALPKDAGDYTLLPPMSYGKVWKDGFQVQKFKKYLATVAPITPQVMAAAYAYLEEALQEPKPFTETGVSEVLQNLYPSADCTQRWTVAYQVISEFYRQGRLHMETRYIPGKTEDLKAPVFYLSLKQPTA